MAKNPTRIPLYSSLAQNYSEKPITWLKVKDAYSMAREKRAVVACAYCGCEDPQSMACKNSDNRSHWIFAKLMDPRRTESKRSPCTLTFGDMQANAEASADHRHNAARDKVTLWPEIHDTRAVTIVAGRGAYIPPVQGDQCDAHS